MTTKKSRKETIPPERHDTVRHDIMHALEGAELSAKEVSGKISVSEKEVYEHLDHIQKSLSEGKRRLKVTPAECVSCGFVFKKRERLKKPGRCPVCRSEHIHDPLFAIITIE
ncbi:MAG: transcriptional regulator [Nitrospirae bacterium]|nr:transcriptional regulator [Nitrospirota bacterium]